MKTLLIVILSLNIHKVHGAIKQEVRQRLPMEVSNELNRFTSSPFTVERNTFEPNTQGPLLMAQESVSMEDPSTSPPSPPRKLSWDMLNQLLEAEFAVTNNLEFAIQTYMKVARQTRDSDIVARTSQLAELKDKAVYKAQIRELVNKGINPSIKASRALIPFLIQAGNVEGAVAHLKQIVKTGSQVSEEPLSLGTLKSQQDTPLALESTTNIGWFTFVLKETSKKPLLGAEFAFVVKTLSRFISDEKYKETTVTVMTQLASEYKETTESQIALAEILAQAKKFNEALKVIETSIPPLADAQIAIFRAQLYQEVQEDQKGLDILVEFLEHNPDSKPVAMTYGLMLWYADKLDPARQQFQTLLNTTASQADLLNYYLAQIAESQGQFKEAKSLYEKVSRNQPYWLIAQIKIAKLILKTEKDFQKAQLHLEGLKKLPLNVIGKVRVYRAEADLLADSGKQGEAIKYYHKLLDTSQGILKRAIFDVYIKFTEKIEQVDMDTIERHSRKFLFINPEDVEILNLLGYMLAEHTDRYQEAHDLIKRAFHLSPNDSYIIDSMGWVLYRLGKYEEALKHLERSLSMKPNPEVAAHVGEVYWILGEKDKARKIWNDSLNRKKSNKEDDKYLLKTMNRLDPPQKTD